MLYPATALSGLGFGVFGVWWETALAQRVPAHLLSRVSAWNWLGALALLPRSTRQLTRLDPGPCGMADPGETPILSR